MFSVYGIRELELTAAHWPPEEYIRWLREGFNTLSDHEKVEQWHLAFDPLQLSIESAPIGQLIGAFADARHAGLVCARRIKSAVEGYFDSPEAHDVTTRQLMIDLWRIYATFDLDESVTPRARRFLNALPQHDATGPLSDLVDAVAAAVAAAPWSAAQLAFFGYLARRDEFWKDRYVGFLLEQLASQPQVQRYYLFWNEIQNRDKFRSALRAIANPETLGGRALIREIYRALNPSSNADQLKDTPEEASRQLRVLAISGEDGGSIEKAPTALNLDNYPALYKIAALRKP